jgi:hypothetical protein
MAEIQKSMTKVPLMAEMSEMSWMVICRGRREAMASNQEGKEYFHVDIDRCRFWQGIPGNVRELGPFGRMHFNPENTFQFISTPFHAQTFFT